MSMEKHQKLPTRQEAPSEQVVRKSLRIHQKKSRKMEQVLQLLKPIRKSRAQPVVKVAVPSTSKEDRGGPSETTRKAKKKLQVETKEKLQVEAQERPTVSVYVPMTRNRDRDGRNAFDKFVKMVNLAKERQEAKVWQQAMESMCVEM